MPSAAKAAILAVLLTGPAMAQTVGGSAPATAPATSCNEIQAGSATGYACLNAKLGAIARNTPRPSSADAPYSATSPSNVTGQYNQAATRERLGSNFGRSSTPERPTPNYTAPFAPRP